MHKTWKIHSSEITPKALDIAKRFSLTPIVSQILVNQDFDTDEKIKSFLNPSLSDLPKPDSLCNIDPAVNRIIEAIDKKEVIAIYGDYDVDGITSTSLLNQFFQDLQIKTAPYVPDRLKEGYGIKRSGIQYLKTKKVSLIITVDNGISAIDAIDYANEVGIDVIVTDHHEPIDDNQLPKAYALINPKLSNCNFPEKSLAGVGIAFYLIIYLRKVLQEKGFFDNQIPYPNLKNYLDYVALGTVADQVPLTGANRILASQGLDVLSSSSRAGLRALSQICSCPAELSSWDVGFKMAPRINAVGRLGSPQKAFALLNTHDTLEAQSLAQDLDQVNTKRKKIQEEIFQEADIIAGESYSESRSLVLFRPHWHIGVVGIVAARLCEKYNKPTILLGRYSSDNICKGSGRSIPSFNIVKGISKGSQFVRKFGGHAMAAGIEIEENQLDSFRQIFEDSVIETIKDSFSEQTLPIDFQLELDQISLKLIEDLKKLGPFGNNNTEPVFCANNLDVVSSTIIKNNHAKLTLASNNSCHEAIWFNPADKIEISKLKTITKADIAFIPKINSWQNRKSISLQILDLKPVVCLLFLLLFSIFFSSTSLLAADNSISMVDTRTIALLNSSSAFSSEGSSNDINPAGAILLPFYRLSAAITSPGKNNNYYNVTVTDAKTSPLGGSISFNHLYDNEDLSAYTINLSLASFYIPKVLSMGINGYYLYYDNELAEEKIKNYNGSIGFIFFPLPNYSLAVTAKNVLNNNTRDIYDRTYIFGLSGLIGAQLRVYLDYYQKNLKVEDSTYYSAAGIEALLKKNFTIYTSYGTYNVKKRGFLAGGARLLLERATIFYAFQQQGYLFDNDTHSLKLTFDF